MAKLNIPRKQIFTHEGAVAQHINPELQLRRSVLSCLLWEKTFYEDGVSIADRILSLVPQVDPVKVANLAIYARSNMKLRHAPLLIARAMAALPEHKKYLEETLSFIIQRPDELSEFLSIYWKTNKGKKSISAQVKRGLAKAFTKFNAYQLAKWNRDGEIKLRDVLFLCHAKPSSDEQAELWKQLISNTLPIPDTWEVELSASSNKRESWKRLLLEKKLGALALLRNLRNIQQSGVGDNFLREAIKTVKTDRVLPFRFISAARYAPQFEPELENVMFSCIADLKMLPGKTVLLVDVSGSMDWVMSEKSEVIRMDTATGLAILARELCEEVKIFSFSNEVKQIPLRRGFALRDAIVSSQPHSGTYLARAINEINNRTDYDRIIVFTDEQSHDGIYSPKGKGYVINISTNKNGVGYYGNWTHIDGFSESTLQFISELEKLR